MWRGATKGFMLANAVSYFMVKGMMQGRMAEKIRFQKPVKVFNSKYQVLRNGAENY